MRVVELAGSGEKITLKALKNLIGSKTKKSVTSVTAQNSPIDEKKVDDVIADAEEKELPEKYLASFNAVTVDVAAQSVLAEVSAVETAPISSGLVEETHDETTFVPSQIAAAIAEQNTNTSDLNSTLTYDQTSSAFTSDSSTITDYHPATHTYNTCRTLISNLGHLTQEETHSIFRAFLQKIGLPAFSSFVKQLQQEEIAALCNQCLTFMNEQGLNWFESKASNFTALSEAAIKSLSVKLKRILVVRGSQRINQSQTQTQSSNLIYLAQ